MLHTNTRVQASLTLSDVMAVVVKPSAHTQKSECMFHNDSDQIFPQYFPTTSPPWWRFEKVQINQV